jgi:hypothetical protein
MRRRLYTGTRRVAGGAGFGALWAWAATRYVWHKPTIDPGAGKVLFQVVGLARTGTTLLANLVNVHPDAYCMSEPYRAFYLYGTCVGGSETSEHPDAFVSRVMRARTETRVGLKETFFSTKHPLDWRNQRFFESLKRQGVITLVVQRDPRDTYASVREFARHSGGVPDGFTNNWKLFAQWAAEYADIAVTYEALVLDPEATMSLVLGALGLSIVDYAPIPQPTTGQGDPKALASRAIDSSSIGSYAARLSGEAVAALEERCQDEMRGLGYL